jgi:protein gp37
MALSSSIEWTDSTWNPVTGCTKISSGCANCYAERMALRLQAAGNPSYANGFSVTMHEDMLDRPLKWKKPQTIFVNSMSDLFHEDIPTEFILQVFDIMRRADWHCFQILTKRSERMLELSPQLPHMPHIWLGVTVEEQGYTFRIDHLRQTGANVKFLSLEPLLGPIFSLNLEGIDWVIVGGESGPRARPIKESWVTDIRNQCQEAKVPFFFKQWGGINKKKAGRELEGRTWDEMPLTSPSML